MYSQSGWTTRRPHSESRCHRRIMRNRGCRLAERTSHQLVGQTRTTSLHSCRANATRAFWMPLRTANRRAHFPVASGRFIAWIAASTNAHRSHGDPSRVMGPCQVWPALISIGHHPRVAGQLRPVRKAVDRADFGAQRQRQDRANAHECLQRQGNRIAAACRGTSASAATASSSIASSA